MNYDNTVLIDYAINLFNGKLIDSKPIHELKLPEKVNLPPEINQIADHLGVSIVQLSIISTFDSDAIDKLLDITYSFEGIKSVLAYRAVQDWLSMLNSIDAQKIESIRSLLYRLGFTETLKEFYRNYAITSRRPSDS